MEKMVKDSDFNLWIEAALEYEYYRKRHENIPDEIKERLEKALEWPDGLSDTQYRALIG